MLAEERRSRILQALESVDSVTTDELAEHLEVSGETIRRDLSVLDQRRQLHRIHGGAMKTVRRTEEPSFAVRAEGSSAKRQIARFAAELIAPGQTIVLDVGTSVLALARALPESFRGTVATCSLLAAAALADRPGVEVLVAGGRIRGGDLALSNAQTVTFFADLRADVAFLGSGGVSVVAGLTDFHLDEIATRRKMIANSVTSYVLADAEKLGRDAPHRVCGIDEVTAVITDHAPAEEARHAFSRAGGRLLYPDRQKGMNASSAGQDHPDLRTETR